MNIASIVGRGPCFPLCQNNKKYLIFSERLTTGLKITDLKRKDGNPTRKECCKKSFRRVRFKNSNDIQFAKWEEKSLRDVLREHKTRNLKDSYTEVFSVAKAKGVINQIEHLGRSYAADNLTNYKVVFPHDIIYTKSPTSEFPFGIIKQNQLGRIGLVSTLYGVFTP